MSRPTLVTAALPYANGPLHFGHVAGAYLPSDIYVRYLKSRGEDVLFMCGTDEHGVAITMKAEQQGKGYQEYVDGWHEVIAGFFAKLGIEFDTFSQTSHRDPHYPLSQEFFLRLLENGKVEPRTTQQHYCLNCDRFLPDRFVLGTCYICHAKGARGDECKSCGSWLDATRLIDPVCAQCSSIPELRETTQYELQLTDFQEDPAMREWYQRFTSTQKANVRTFVVNKMVEGEGMKARAITRDLPWGVPVPEKSLRGEVLQSVENKVLYVWFDAPIGYITATMEWAREQGTPDAWRRYWICKHDEEGPRLLHFIGKDNIPFHCIVFPCMLGWQALADKTWSELPDFHPMGPGPGERFVLPEAVPANEFYNLEGKKFSTSDHWYIDLAGTFERYSSDQLRYYLASSMPETADSNFYWKDFQAKVNELADTLGNFALRILRFVHKYRDGKVPGGDLTQSPLFSDCEKAIREARDRYESALSSFEFRAGIKAFLDLARFGNKLVDDEKPWALRKSDPDKCDEVLAIGLFLIKALVPLVHPYTPGIAAALSRMLGTETGSGAWDDMTQPLPAGHALGEVEMLVPKVEDEQIAEEVERLHGLAEAGDNSSPA